MFSNEEKAKEAEREVKMREQVYGRHTQGKFTSDQKRRIEIMLEIAAEYRVKAESERLV
jgi:hypothetical protein